MHARSTRRSTRAFLRKRIAAGARGAGAPRPAVARDTNVYRLVNSEGDDLPGLVVDVYADAAVVQITTLAMSMRRAEIYDALEAELGVKTIFELAPAVLRGAGGVRGRRRGSRAAPRAPRVAGRRERHRAGGRAALRAEDRHVHRPARDAGARRGAGARARACWTSTPTRAGSGSPRRARGAAAVTAVDSSARAVARITAHAATNGVAIDAIEADAFRYLETATPRAFDLVVIDPPKFARARKDLDAARKGYERLNALALQAVAAGGILVTCSCSQNVDAETFERIVAAGAKQAGREVRVFERRGPAADHLLPPGFTEGQYLKVLLCYVT